MASACTAQPLDDEGEHLVGVWRNTANACFEIYRSPGGDLVYSERSGDGNYLSGRLVEALTGGVWQAEVRCASSEYADDEEPLGYFRVALEETMDCPSGWRVVSQVRCEGYDEWEPKMPVLRIDVNGNGGCVEELSAMATMQTLGLGFIQDGLMVYNGTGVVQASPPPPPPPEEASWCPQQTPAGPAASVGGDNFNWSANAAMPQQQSPPPQTWHALLGDNRRLGHGRSQPRQVRGVSVQPSGNSGSFQMPEQPESSTAAPSSGCGQDGRVAEMDTAECTVAGSPSMGFNALGYPSAAFVADASLKPSASALAAWFREQPEQAEVKIQSLRKIMKSGSLLEYASKLHLELTPERVEEAIDQVKERRAVADDGYPSAQSYWYEDKWRERAYDNWKYQHFWASSWS